MTSPQDDRPQLARVRKTPMMCFGSMIIVIAKPTVSFGSAWYNPICCRFRFVPIAVRGADSRFVRHVLWPIIFSFTSVWTICIFLFVPIAVPWNLHSLCLNLLWPNNVCHTYLLNMLRVGTILNFLICTDCCSVATVLTLCVVYFGPMMIVTMIGAVTQRGICLFLKRYLKHPRPGAASALTFFVVINY